jgi:FkbM family methyltransferase
MSQFNLPSLAEAPGIEFLWEYLSNHPAPARKAALASAEQLAFLGFCVEHLPRSHAQLLQDLFVLYRTKLKRNGFFVEFGATDGVDLSNTCLLERDHGWTGILAEPFPVWHAALAANRRAVIDHRCVWTSSGDRMAFIASREPELAGLQATADEDMHAARRATDAGEIQVTTVSLLDLLEQHGAPRDIDYLSVDTEGSEFDILAAFDFSRYRIRIVSVEHNYMETKREAIRELLARHGYRREFEAFSSWDDWYVRPDLF